ncbi:MAG: TIGR01777 family oxidoreductase [Terriglobales bacterium]
MKIAILGGTGQVGTLLARAFHKDGHEVIVFGRQSPKFAPWRIEQWNLASVAGWSDKLDGADVVINLAGRSVNCRYTPQNRREILQSRVESVRAVGDAIAKVKRPPRVWLQASTATIYAHTYDAPNDETSGVIGGAEPNVPDTWRFSIDVAMAWEKALDEIVARGTRKVKLRSAVIMSPDRGGIFDTLLALVRRGIGGTSGDGRQYVSWIHEADFIGAIYFLIERDDIDGVVNLASPNPVSNREFMADLRRAWGTNIGLPSAKWMLEIGAVFLRTETELILKSRRVIPGRLLRKGFSFVYPDWPDAARELCKQWKAERH